jgi:hypothetical protein
MAKTRSFRSRLILKEDNNPALMVEPLKRMLPDLSLSFLIHIYLSLLLKTLFIFHFIAHHFSH